MIGEGDIQSMQDQSAECMKASDGLYKAMSTLNRTNNTFSDEDIGYIAAKMEEARQALEASSALFDMLSDATGDDEDADGFFDWGDTDS